MPPTRPWVQRLINFQDAATLRPNQGQVDRHMAEVEGGRSDDCREILAGGEEGGSSDQRIHHAS